MKQTLTLSLLCISLLSFSQRRIKVLFIGNSYTYYNNLPQAVADLAKAQGDTVVFDSNTPGGTTFQMHSTNATTLSKIAQGGWDYVVLQAQSQEPSFPPAQVESQTYPYAQVLDSLIHAADSCTETVFYMTWVRKNGDSSNCASYPPLCTYSGMQDRLTYSYMEMGQLNQATVAPAGEAWRKVKAQSTGFDLYQSDQSHPTIWGTYLVASVFYEILFQKSVLNDTFVTAGITRADALLLRQAAHSTVSDSLSKWLVSGHVPVASFRHTVSGAQASMTSTSINGQQFVWDYGDQTNGQGATTTHTYAASGTYPVKLTVTDRCRVSTYTDSVSVTVTHLGVEETKADIARIYPNPAQAAINVDLKGAISPQGGSIQLYNTLGQLVWSAPSVAAHNVVTVLDLADGSYRMVIRNGSEQMSYPILLKR